jgi:hypothetical protein
LIAVRENKNKKERIKMKSKTKNTKVPKSAKTRLSDLTPKKDAVGGQLTIIPPGGVAGAGGGGAAGTPPGYFPKTKKRVNL